MCESLEVDVLGSRPQQAYGFCGRRQAPLNKVRTMIFKDFFYWDLFYVAAAGQMKYL